MRRRRLASHALSLSIDPLASAFQVVDVGGPEALEKLSVVVHISSDQEKDVLTETAQRHFYGLSAANLMFVPQASHAGFNYDDAQRLFTEVWDMEVWGVESGRWNLVVW